MYECYCCCLYLFDSECFDLLLLFTVCIEKLSGSRSAVNGAMVVMMREL